jgi:hypothetical protein
MLQNAVFKFFMVDLLTIYALPWQANNRPMQFAIFQFRLRICYFRQSNTTGNIGFDFVPFEQLTKRFQVFLEVVQCKKSV